MFELSVEQVRQTPMGELAALLDALSADELAAVTAGTGEAVVLAAQRVKNAVDALALQAIAAIAAREREWLEAIPVDAPVGTTVPTGGTDDEWEFVADRIAPLLCLTGRAADLRVALARDLGRLPRTLAAMREGRLDAYRAGLVGTEAQHLSDAQAAVLEETLLPDEPVLDRFGREVPDATGLTSTKLRARARRAVARIDPDALRRRAERAPEGRFVFTRPGTEPGMTQWCADQPTHVSAQAWAAIDALARDYLARDAATPHRRTLDQARADAMIDLILGNASVTTVLELTVPVPSEPGVVGVELPRHGILPMDVVSRLVNGCDTPLRRLLLDPVTGQVLRSDPTTYRPNAALARAVRTRDGTCRFPGCAVAATGCDLDHVLRFPDGPTDEANLMALCRHHHRLKHQAGWRVQMSADAVCTWTTPSGMEHVSRPRDYRDLAA
ncbi:DUF222 domain-containing protein [Oryzihumus sp.]